MGTITYNHSDKNRLLRRAAMTENPTIIHRPKGSVGEAGFSLITEMKLDKQSSKDKGLYNDILVRFKLLRKLDVADLKWSRHLSVGSRSLQVSMLAANIRINPSPSCPN
jgi:hypothetical protein